MFSKKMKYANVAVVLLCAVSHVGQIHGQDPSQPNTFTEGIFRSPATYPTFSIRPTFDIKRESGIFRRELVAVLAVRGGSACPTTDIFQVGDRLDVIRVHACSYLTKVIQLQSFGNRPFEQSVSSDVSVGRQSLRGQINTAVAARVQTTLPDPARAFHVRWTGNFEVTTGTEQLFLGASSNGWSGSVHLRTLNGAVFPVEPFESPDLPGDIGTTAFAFVKLLFSHFASTTGDFGQGRCGVDPPRGPFQLLYPSQEPA